MQKYSDRRAFLLRMAAVAGSPLYSAALVAPGGASLKEGDILAIGLGMSTPSIAALKVLDVFGLHDAPYPGGSSDIELALSDFARLRVKAVLSIDPTQEFIDRVSATDAVLIIRCMMHENRCDIDSISQSMSRLSRSVDTPVVQPFNEVNLPSETGGHSRSPEEHVDADFLPASELIVNCGGTALLTPLAQRAVIDGIDEFEYFRRMLARLSEQKTKSWIRKNVGVSIHAYTFEPGDDPWPRVVNLSNLIKEATGLDLSIYVTESGLHQSEWQSYDELSYAEETVRLLGMTIPEEVRDHVNAVCFWVYASDAQMPVNISEDDRIWPFELAAWRGNRGENLVYRALEAHWDSGHASTIDGSPQETENKAR